VHAAQALEADPKCGSLCHEMFVEDPIEEAHAGIWSRLPVTK